MNASANPAPEPDPHLDPARWDELIEAVGVDSLLLVIQSRMSERLLAHYTVDDIWQETLLHAWRDRARFTWQGHKMFRSWLLAIARNRIRDLIDWLEAGKRRGRAATLSLSSLAPDDASSISRWLPAHTQTPGRLAYYRERALLMEQALRALEPETQAIVRGHLFEQETMEVIAARLAIPVATAWYRFRKGAAEYSRKLQELLDLSGLKPPPPQTPD